MSETNLELVNRLSRDLKEAAATLSPNEARYLVDAYYTIQENRKTAANQLRTLVAGNEPRRVIEWLAKQNDVLENQIKRALDKWSDSHDTGLWAKSITGIGPVIAAGLLAHIDINKAPTAGHIWRYAGLDPTSIWEKGERRPWNASLKVLCWKIGDCFVKFSNHKDDVYGKVYLERKQLEIANNDRGQLEAQAREKLTKFKIDKKTDAYKWYSGQYPAGTSHRWASLETTDKRNAFLKSVVLAEGTGLPMLPPAHIQARAQRYAVKLFLSHYHHVAFVNTFQKDPPKPYILEHGGHVDFVKPPNFPMTT